MDDFFMREGWLQKKGVEGLKSWTKRYFTLEDEELYYYENKGDVAPKGRIQVVDIDRVDSVSASFWSRGYYFNVVTKNRTYELCADDDTDRKEWISILQRASSHFKKMAKEEQQTVNTSETYDASDFQDEDDEHVELTEEDMNDPELLGQLTELHGKEGLQEQLKELDAKIESEKKQCIQLRDAGKIEDAKKLLLKVKNLQNQKQALELKIQNWDENQPEEELVEEPTAEPEPEPDVEEEEEEPIEEEEPSHYEEKNVATEESLQEVERRIEGFKNLALNAKKQGNLTQAAQYMKSYKVLLQAKEQLDVGIQMDLNKLPSPGSAATPVATASPTPAASSNTAAARPKSQSITPPPTKNAESERLEALSILEEELRRQYEVAKTKALAAKEKGDKHTALEQLNITKDVKHHLEEIIKAKSLPHVPVPKYHFETKEYTVEKKHDDLLDNEIEISILNCKGIKDPAITSPYFYILLPYPNAEDPQKSTSSSISLKSPDVNFVCKMSIERKKSFQLLCERKKISIEMYQSRLLLSSVLLGKGEIKLSPLLEKCEIKETVEIKNGRKLVCVVDMFVRMKRPVLKQHVDKIVEKVLVIDEHFTSVAPPNEPPKESPKESKKEEVLPQPGPSKKQEEPKKEVEAASPPSEDDYLSVDYLISNDVLEWERDGLAAKISAYSSKGQSPPDELVDRKQAVELKLQILSVQASTGQLDQDKYIQDMKDKIVVEKKLAAKLSKEGNKEGALLALKRVKIMEKEIEASLE